MILTLPNDDTIHFDPNLVQQLPGGNGALFSPEQILAHEIGHAVGGAADDGPGSMNNVNKTENPIAIELGQFPRTQYNPW